MTRFLPGRALLGAGIATAALSGYGAASIAGARTAVDHRSPAAQRGSHRTTLEVRVASVAGARRAIIETASGRAVYLLRGDSIEHPLCRGRCLGIWPAVTAVRPTAAGVHGRLGVWRHAGIRQVTLDGHPLYTFSYDTSGRQASGEGIRSFGGEWFALSAAGSAVPAPTRSAPAPTTSAPAPTTSAPAPTTPAPAPSTTSPAVTTTSTTPSTTTTTPGYGYGY